MRLILEPGGSLRIWVDNDEVATTSRAVPTSARSRLLAAATFGAIGLSLSAIHAVSGYGIPCPWRALTHTLCPFCGATTMGSELLHGDFRAAWQANQFVFVLLIGLAIACIAWVVELAGGPAVRLRGRLADQRIWYGVLGTAALAFAVVRNLVPLG